MALAINSAVPPAVLYGSLVGFLVISRYIGCGAGASVGTGVAAGAGVAVGAGAWVGAGDAVASGASSAAGFGTGKCSVAFLRPVKT